MPIEPYAVRTVSTPRVMPPPVTKPIPKPKLTMAQEAEIVMKRYKRTFGSQHLTDDSRSNQNEISRLAALEKREKVKASLMAAVASSDGLTSRDISKATGTPYDAVLGHMRDMLRDGLIKAIGKNRSGNIWVKA